MATIKYSLAKSLFKYIKKPMTICKPIELMYVKLYFNQILVKEILKSTECFNKKYA